MASKGTMFFKGDRGKSPDNIVKTTVANPQSLATLDALHTWIITNVSDCTKARNTFSDANDPVVIAPGTDVLTDVKAVFLFRDTDTGGIVRMVLPAPMATIIVAEGDGDRIQQSVCESLASELSVATGKSLSAIRGWVEQVQ